MRAGEELDEYVAHFRARVLQDALASASRGFWLRRAAELEAARHRPGIDFTGRASVEELRARWTALTASAAACRARAEVALIEDTTDEAAGVLADLGEVA